MLLYPTLDLAQAAKEFPKDVLEMTFPAIPATWDDESWHNDTSPSFSLDVGGVRLVLWVDPEDPAESEWPEERISGHAKRYTLYATALDPKTAEPVDTTTFTVTETDDIRAALAAAIGEAFVAKIRESHTAAEFAAIRHRNAQYIREGKTDVCATHDFCDANDPMAAAVEAVLGITLFDLTEEEAPQRHEDFCRLWGEAWAAAKPALTAKEGERS